jgi:hypothetical protein
MVRIRLYGLVLSLPIILILSSFLLMFAVSSRTAFNIGMPILIFGFGLQALFALTIACPKCGKSPYAIGPNAGPVSFAGKPWPDAECSKCGHKFTAP